MNRYNAYFDGYYFKGNVQLIKLRDITGRGFYMKQGFINAKKVPYLIGNLIVDFPIEFDTEEILGPEIIAPQWINYHRTAADYWMYKHSNPKTEMNSDTETIPNI